MSFSYKMSRLFELIKSNQWRYISDRIRRVLSWYKVSYFVKKKQFATMGENNKIKLSGFSLSLDKKASYIVKDLTPGELKIAITHTDCVVMANRKSIYVKIEGGVGNNYKQLAEHLNINYNNKFPFAYMGGRNESVYGTQLVNLNLPANITWLKFTFYSSIDRQINIDEFNISKSDKYLNLSGNFNDISLKNINISNLKQARAIIFTDIDVNVIDGSSVWLSSMTSILCNHSTTILLLKRDLVDNSIISNIINPENLIILQPKDFGLAGITLTSGQLVNIVRKIDSISPRIDVVISRGLNLSFELLSDRQFYDRADIYLTDFYQHYNGEIIISEENKTKINIITQQARTLLVQTSEIEDCLRSLTNNKFDSFQLPPSVPIITDVAKSHWQLGDTIKICYSGKISPNWGLIELFDWTEELVKIGIPIKLTIIGNKISDGSSKDGGKKFRNYILNRMKDLNVNYLDGRDRSQVADIMRQQDFSWCWRPQHFEDATLELSTKLVEGLALGLACIVYPSRINENICGKNYPFFISCLDDLTALLNKKDIIIPKETTTRVYKQYNIYQISKNYNKKRLNKDIEKKPVITISGHDLKFIDPYISYLRNENFGVYRDLWEWGEARDLKLSKQLHYESDIVFAEWGLANAVWLSKNLEDSKRLFIRIHLQEINPNAAKFGHQIHYERVEKLIFVSQRVRDEAMKMFNWPIDKTIVIPNFVLEDEYELKQNYDTKTIRLGILGIVPERKRFDRALDILEALLEAGHDTTLAVKGPRPETLSFMHAPNRIKELDYYTQLYDRINASQKLKDAVLFEDWGNNVAQWYSNVDHILSPSDFESFHYALADGVLSGCQPIIWPWEEAATIYKKAWIVTNTNDATTQILNYRKLTKSKRKNISKENREFIVSHYGSNNVFKQLTNIIIRN